MDELKAKITEVKELVDQLEISADAVSLPEPSLDLTGIEAVDVVKSAVDFLFPLVTPYEASLYMHLLRHSVLADGRNTIRVSIRGLRTGYIKSSRSKQLSRTHLSKVLAGLEDVGALRKEGEPNKEGALYRLFLPAEIGACEKLREAKIADAAIITVEDEEVDYYNVRENRRKIYERDDYVCKYCGQQLTLMTSTLDHVVPVSEGGDNGKDNLVTACLSCNSRKNRKPVGDFMAERE